MKKPAIPLREDERLRSLKNYGVLDTLPEKIYDQITKLASEICGTPIALVSLIDENRQWFKSHHGLVATETPRDVSFCGHAIHQTDGVFEIPDSTADSRFADNPLVTGAPNVIFYAGAPLKTPAGENIGTLCVIDHAPKKLTDKQKRLLEGLAEQVVTLFEMRKSANQIVDESTAIFNSSLELERSRAELIEAKAEAERASATKSTFLANMSHEIRTPLGAIIGFTDLMREREVPTEERNQYLETISRNGKALTRIIDDILDLAKVESGMLEVEKIEFSFPDLIDEVMDVFRERTKAKNIFLRANLPDDIDQRIISDPTRLRQILLNVVGNAVKFTEQGGVTIKIKSEAQASSVHLLQISVQDTGVGMSPEQQSRLFQPFMQADNSTTRKFGGTGLGLALSKRLANALGGDIAISDCKPNEGCIFTISFKAEAPSRPAPVPRGPAAKEISKELHRPKLTGVRILVADDSLDNQMLVKLLLNRDGAEVETASNGLEAYRMAISGSFDIVLMDIQMPELDGYESTRMLREAGYRKPIIALTAHAMAEERARSMAAGCNGHLTKPLNQVELIATVQFHVEASGDGARAH